MESIFIQIASYRDSELVHTIKSAIRHAKYSDRLTFGICWQYDELTFIDLDPFMGKENFRIDQYYYKESKGCCWARNKTNQLYNNEDYTLQIDAHTRFVDDWDIILIDMLQSIDAPKPLLTTYPPPYELVDGKVHKKKDRGIQKLKLVHIRKNLTTEQSTALVKDTSKPGKSPLLAAGLIFTKGIFCKEVEYDPKMYFSGEEISLAARAYTWGYDFFYPNKNVIWHRYQHPMPLHWTDHSNVQRTLNDQAFTQLSDLLLEYKDLLQYGLGRQRTLQQFEEYAGLNFKERATKVATPTLFEREIDLETQEIQDRHDYQYWIFSLLDEDDQEIFRYDITDPGILNKHRNKMKIHTPLSDCPISYVLWPYSREIGYTNKCTFKL